MKVSTILDQVEEINARERRYDPFTERFSAKLEDATSLGPTRGMGFAEQTRYDLLLRIGVSYWANPAQRSEARETAEKAMQDILYRDVAGRLAQIRQMLDNGDRRAIQLAITDLIGDLRP